jgi:hypothetical protein
MRWRVEFHHEFYEEFKALSAATQDDMLAKALVLEAFGPQLGRPIVDTLKGSRHSNMKELRLDSNDGVWRIAFAFDTELKAILLVAGDKSGKNQRKFYKELIKVADNRFEAHLKDLKK